MGERIHESERFRPDRIEPSADRHRHDRREGRRRRERRKQHRDRHDGTPGSLDLSGSECAAEFLIVPPEAIPPVPHKHENPRQASPANAGRDAGGRPYSSDDADDPVKGGDHLDYRA